jgi:hypothetical protein
MLDEWRLPPWDVERFSLDEWNALQTHMQKRVDAAKKQRKKAGRG